MAAGILLVMQKVNFEKIFMELDSGKFGIPEIDSSMNARGKLVIIGYPSYELYRKWHNNVGRPYMWHTRRRINDRIAIEELLRKPGVEMTLLTLDGEPVGYSLIEMNTTNEVEISDFGFLPGHVGKGYGTFFLPLIIRRLIDRGAKRIWLSTRSTNHPKVVDFYRKLGFNIYRREQLTGEHH